MPDEAAQIAVLRYINPRRAEWPEADYVVGNPPFIGAATMRRALGDGYVEALRKAWHDVPDSADFVMYWWQKAAELTRQEKLKRFGFITTNSITQTFNRRVIQQNLAAAPPLSLAFAIPDHPWVDSADGAAVRIAMTVGKPGAEGADGVLATVVAEREGSGEGVDVELTIRKGLLNADLTVGANVSSSVPLLSNVGMSSMGVKLHGQGFVVNDEQAISLGLGRIPGIETYLPPYVTSRGLVQQSKCLLAIDLFGLTADEARSRFPEIYQWLNERVKPERDAKGHSKDGAAYAKLWWIFGKPRKELRLALAGLPRYIATARTAKHRIFVFLNQGTMPESEVVAIASDDAFLLGALSSKIHEVWALTAGGNLGVGNDPRYNNSLCFNTFPFPTASDAQKQKIRALAEELDAHRKRQQSLYPELTLTGMYNVLEKLKAGEALTAKDKVIHEQGLVSVLKQLHDELDAAVAAAYGWRLLT